jgi:hypothetical protein
MDNGGSGLGALSNNTSSIVENPFDRRADYATCAQDLRHALRINGLYTLPFHGNRLVEGWQISGIVTSSTGLPFNTNTGYDSMGAGQGVNPGTTPRPNVVAGCQLEVGLPTEWFNPACFSAPVPGTPGNAGRNLGRGPHLQDTDISISKETKIREGLQAQFRAEVFNVFNHTNLGLPAFSIFSAGPAGACTATGAGCAVPNAQAGRITTIVGNPRQFQFGLKLIF